MKPEQGEIALALSQGKVAGVIYDSHNTIEQIIPLSVMPSRSKAKPGISDFSFLLPVPSMILF